MPEITPLEIEFPKGEKVRVINKPISHIMDANHTNDTIHANKRGRVISVSTHDLRVVKFNSGGQDYIWTHNLRNLEDHNED